MTGPHTLPKIEPGTRDVVIPRFDRRPVDVGRSVLVTIGIDRYQHWGRLGCAVSDARGARAMFATLGFEDAVPPLYDEAATRDALLALVTDQLQALSEHDRLILFYAGHGGTRIERPGGQEAKTGYLIPVDAADDDKNVTTWLDLGDWLRRVSLLPPRHILVILDCCHSGIALHPTHRWRGREPRGRGSLTTLQARLSRRVITSALDDQLALDGGPREGHSLFTGCLLDTLEEARDARTMLTGSALGLRVQALVTHYPRSPQTPDFGTFDRDERGELVLSDGDGSAEIKSIEADWRDVAPAQIIPAGPLIALPAPEPVWRRWLWVIGLVFWLLFVLSTAGMR